MDKVENGLLSKEQRMCRACNQPITDRYVLRAIDSFWHEGCLKCACCECRLGDIGSSLYCKSDLILCKRDYLRLFGIPGKCSQCNKPIAAFELVMRARDNAYHIECFGCQVCRKRLVVGESYCFHDNKVLCLDRCARDIQTGKMTGSLDKQAKSSKVFTSTIKAL